MIAIAEAARAVLRETGLLPHLNPGVLDASAIALLRTVSVSQGLMLESVGAVVSTTVMSNVPFVVRPPVSVAEHEMLVVPSGSSVPIAGLQAGVGAVASSASEADTA